MAQDTYTYLRSLPSIRDRCYEVFGLGQKGSLKYWDLDLTQQTPIVDFVVELIARDYGTAYNSIPPHGRWRHFVGDRVDPILAKFTADKVDATEVARRLVDLMVVSVLLDAGAGNVWKFTPSDGGAPIARSEGLGVGSLEMFAKGYFSSDATQPYRVDNTGLAKITPALVAEAMQVSAENPMDGIDGRAGLLARLGGVISAEKNAAFFTRNGESRPGYLVDYLLEHSGTKVGSGETATSIQMPALWDAVIVGLNDVWPAGRTKLNGAALGDVWPCESLEAAKGAEDGANLVPFHKLSQWMTYSIIEVLEKMLGWEIVGREMMTGLPEYRNGGLLVDFKLLVPRFDALAASFDVAPATDLLALPAFHASHPAIVEFRAVTIVMLDRIAEDIRKKLGFDFSLPQVLEAGTWKAGREIAAKLRPETKGPPFNIISDGTIF